MMESEFSFLNSVYLYDSLAMVFFALANNICIVGLKPRGCRSVLVALNSS